MSQNELTWRKVRNQSHAKLPSRKQSMVLFMIDFALLKIMRNDLGGGGNSTHYVTGTCHFSLKIGTHNSVNSGGF